MESDAMDDAERLVGCLKRGISQRFELASSTRRQGISNAPLKPCLDTPPRELRHEGTSISTPEGMKMELSKVSRQISPGVFYGSPAGKPATRPPQLMRLLNEIKTDLAVQKTLQSRVSGDCTETSDTRAAIWATFPRQEQAIQFASSHGDKRIAVFTYQDHINGQRRFLATTYDEFWLRYSSMHEDFRHHYEIIQEGMPCHLYFDLEFNRQANKDADGIVMVDLLLSVVQDVLFEVYHLKYEHSWVVELDSSTEEKFSRHLIIHTPKAAFKDNSHVGLFVGEICKRIGERREIEDGMNQLFVLQGEALATYHTQIFVDQAVYSRNRSFRLPFSTKAGKAARLVPTTRFRCQSLGTKESFMDSLICLMEENCTTLLTFSKHSLDRGGALNFETSKALPRNLMQSPTFCISGKSPFPSLDVFVESVACIGDVQGKIRSWYCFADYGVVVYNISDNRFCENIGRPHKSNNVMYIVDFRTAGYYQKCHDPDCRGYRSPLRPIPRHAIPPEFPLSTVHNIQDTLDLEIFSKESEEDKWWQEVISSSDCGSQLQESPPSQADDEDESWWMAVVEQMAHLIG